MQTTKNTRVMIDGSRIIIEALVQSGAEVYIGYPITPANWLYAYANERFPIFLAAPDEITALQWAAGFSASGKLPVTGTSFPGFALMMETLNMAFMMELPLVIVLAQRLGPSTGSATTGAQGDLLLLRGAISGGYPLPVFCISDLQDCWELASRSVAAALKFRTPVVLLTSKEMVMTSQSFDVSQLAPITRQDWITDSGNGGLYEPYRPGDNLVPSFLAVGNSRQQVRLNASTHDHSGLIRKATPEAMANTRRLKEKLELGMPAFTLYDHDDQEDSHILIVTYGISSGAVRQAVVFLRERGRKVSFLILKTLLPVSPAILEILSRYRQLVIVEENMSGLLTELLYGCRGNEGVRKVNKIGRMITPEEVEKEVETCYKAS